MAAEQFDHGSARQRGEKFVGRAAVLARLDQLLVDGDADRWVVVIGGPGVGKTALLAAWLSRREAAGALVPHHVIRRGESGWDDPARIVGSLVAQIEARVPDLQEPEAHVRMHPATRLAAVLARAGAVQQPQRLGRLAALWARVSARDARRRGQRLVIVIDGLDEYDAPVAFARDPLAAVLPYRLPGGVSVLCASRPGHPYVASLAAQGGEVVQIDLDDPDDNAATVRALWKQAARPLGVDARFVDEAVARAEGNALHAVTWQRHVAALPADPRRVEDIPRGLAALLEASWQGAAAEASAVDGLGILCAAREALAPDELGAAAGWTGEAEREAFVRGAGALVAEVRRPDGTLAYRLHHEAIRAHVADAIEDDALRAHHAELAGRLATWPEGSAGARWYALRHALIHRAEAGDWADAWRIAADSRFLEARCRELGVYDTEAEVARVAERCRASGEVAFGRRFSGLAGALAREATWLRAAPEATCALVWNRLRRSGWSATDLDRELGGATEGSFLRVRRVATRDSPALIGELAGHAGDVTGCAVTADGRRVVSVSQDRTLRVWDLESGRALAILKGHAREVTSCAVTADGRRAVSASSDATLKVWDLEQRRVLATLVGHDLEVNACAVTADGRRAVSASSDGTLKVWDLESGQALATLAGHSSGVTACAVTPDDRRVVSASNDGTLKVWELESGRALATLEGHSKGVTACAVTADGRRVVSASSDRVLKIWDLETELAPPLLPGRTGAVTADGHRVASASDAALPISDLESGLAPPLLPGHAGAVNACVLAADGRRAVSASRDGTLKVWDVESGRALAALEGHRGGVNACAVTADGRRAVSGSEDRRLKVWDLESGQAIATLKGHGERVNACAVTADGRRAVSGSEDRTLKVWDLESGRALTTMEVQRGVLACAVTADGRRAVSASQDWMLRVWDLESGQELAVLKGHSGLVNACAVTADRRVVSASWDRTLKVWDLESGRPLATLNGHIGSVTACAVTPDGRWAVSGSEDRTLKVWDLEAQACVFTHRGDAVYTTVAVTAGAIVAGDVTGNVWFLDWPSRGHRPEPLAVGAGVGKTGTPPAVVSPR